MTITADSSFFVSFYIQDVHSPEAIRRMSSAPAVSVTPLNRAEIAHAVQQQVFRGRLSRFDANRAWGEFEQDCAAKVWIPEALPESVWTTTMSLAMRFGSSLGVRTLDSLHVACALELGAVKFWTFDERQARLAEAAGLDTAA